MSVWTDN